MIVTGGAARACAGALLVSLALAVGARAADNKTYLMKISIATVGDALHQYAKNYAAAVTKDSGGRIKAEIYPASQLGSIQQQAEGVQFGAIQCQILPPEQQTAMLQMLASVGADVSKTKPLLSAAYKVITDAAK